MPLLETLALTIGPAIAKNILKDWLGEGNADIFGSLIDLLCGNIKDSQEKRELAKQVNKIGERVAHDLKPLFDVEFSSLKSDDRIPVVHEIASTLEEVKISSASLLENNLDANQLNKFLLEMRPQATILLSMSQSEMYRRIIEGVSQAVIEYASQFSDFDRLLAHRILKDQALIISKLDKILTEPETGAKHYEHDYREAIKEKLDHFELFGIPNRDYLVRRQKLSEAYVVLNTQITNIPETEKIGRKAIVDE